LRNLHTLFSSCLSREGEVAHMTDMGKRPQKAAPRLTILAIAPLPTGVMQIDRLAGRVFQRHDFAALASCKKSAGEAPVTSQ
jgi:hypothetical protein